MVWKTVKNCIFDKLAEQKINCFIVSISVSIFSVLYYLLSPFVSVFFSLVFTCLFYKAYYLISMNYILHSNYLYVNHFSAWLSISLSRHSNHLHWSLGEISANEFELHGLTLPIGCFRSIFLECLKFFLYCHITLTMIPRMQRFIFFL